MSPVYGRLRYFLKSRGDNHVDRLVDHGRSFLPEGRGADPDPVRALADPIVSGDPRTMRVLLVLGWAAALLALLGTVAVSWERIVGRLSGTPRPADVSAPPITRAPVRGRGEAAVAEALRFLEAGDAERALRALDRIPSDDPALPYARQVRAQAESALGASR
jgi:hypothetical protein